MLQCVFHCVATIYGDVEKDEWVKNEGKEKEGKKERKKERNKKERKKARRMHHAVLFY